MNKLLDYAPTAIAKLSVIADIIESDYPDSQKYMLIIAIFNKQSREDLKEATK